jgi:hypothetical protein
MFDRRVSLEEQSVTEMCPGDEVAAQSGHTPSIVEIEREVRFEHMRIKRATAQYHEIAAKGPVGDTTPGIKLMRDVIPGLTKAIAAAQQEVIDGIGANLGGMGHASPKWWWRISVLHPEKMAIITLRSATECRPHETTVHRSRRNVAKAIGSAVRQELEFEQWEEAERAKAAQHRADAKAAAEAGEDIEPRRDLVKLLMTRYPTTNAKTWGRWKAKWKIASLEPWDVDDRIHAGSKLIDLLVESGKGWFELREITKKGKSEIILAFSDAAQAALRDMATEESLTRPYRGPMICPPKPWVYIAPKQKDVA